MLSLSKCIKTIIHLSKEKKKKKAEKAKMVSPFTLVRFILCVYIYIHVCTFQSVYKNMVKIMLQHCIYGLVCTKYFCSTEYWIWYSNQAVLFVETVLLMKLCYY